MTWNVHKVDPDGIQKTLSQIYDADAMGLVQQADEILHNGQDHPAVWVEPRTEEQVVDLLRVSSESGWTVGVMGAGTQLRSGHLGGPVDVVVRLTRMNRVLDFAPGDLVVSVQPGVTLNELQAVLASEGKMLPLDPFVPARATIGGITAFGASGPRRALYGTVRDMAIGLRVIYPDGKVIRTGGKVVKNVAGYDMTKMFVGSRGTLGVMTELTFKLRPMPLHHETVILAGTAKQISRIQGVLLSSILIAARAEAVQTWAISTVPESDISGGVANQWLLAIDCDENETSATYQRNQLIAWANDEGMASRVLIGEASDNWWTTLRDSVLDADLTIRVAGPPTKWANLIASVEQLVSEIQVDNNQSGNEAAMEVAESWSVTVGVGRLFLRNVSDESAIRIVSRLRALVTEFHGSVVIEHGSASLRKRIDPYGATDGARILFERIKNQIDPGRMLLPGTFAGGI